MPKVPNKLTKTPAVPDANGDGITSPYDSSIRWALYDHERSNETLGGAMDQLSGELQELNTNVENLKKTVEDFGDKLDELMEILKSTTQKDDEDA